MLFRLLVAVVFVALPGQLFGEAQLPESPGLRSGNYMLQLETYELEGKELGEPEKENSLATVVGEGNIFAIRPKQLGEDEERPPAQVTQLHETNEFRGRSTKTGALKAAMTRVTLSAEDITIRTIHLMGQVTDTGAAGSLIMIDSEGKVVRRAKWELKRIE